MYFGESSNSMSTDGSVESNRNGDMMDLKDTRDDGLLKIEVVTMESRGKCALFFGRFCRVKALQRALNHSYPLHRSFHTNNKEL